MMKRFLCVLFLFVPVMLSAQTATSSQKLLWNQDAPDLATAQAYTYKHYDDSAATGVAFVTVTCTGTASPFTCAASFPAFTPGSHTVQITASNLAGEGGKSTAFSFTFVAVPGIPTNVRIGS